MTAPQAQQAFRQGVTFDGPASFSPRRSDFEIWAALRRSDWAALEPGTQGNLFAYTPMPLQPSQRPRVDVDVPLACEGAVDDWYDALNAAEQPKVPVTPVPVRSGPVYRVRRRMTGAGAAVAVAITAFVLAAMQQDSQSGDAIVVEAPLLEKQDRLQPNVYEMLKNRPFLR